MSHVPLPRARGRGLTNTGYSQWRNDFHSAVKALKTKVTQCRGEAIDDEASQALVSGVADANPSARAQAIARIYHNTGDFLDGIGRLVLATTITTTASTGTLDLYTH